MLKQSADIDMVSEDLFISADEVRVRYVFRNRAPQDVRVTVAFPLPDHDLAEDFYGDVAYPSDFAHQGRRPPGDDGGRAAGAAERDRPYRACSPDSASRSWTATAGIAERRARSRRFRRPTATGSVALDLAEPIRRADRRASRRSWTVRETRYWEQTFPAGRDLVVEHSYRPGTGQATATGLAHPEYLRGEGRQAMIDRYCIDEAFLAAVDRGTRQAGGGQPAYSEQWVSYILTTGANWRSPIGDFRLVVDKGDPSHLVSFCGEGVRRIAPTRFEMRRQNWRPTRDLHILILRPIAPATDQPVLPE